MWALEAQYFWMSAGLEIEEQEEKTNLENWKIEQLRDKYGNQNNKKTSKMEKKRNIPVETGRKLNVYKTFRRCHRRPGRPNFGLMIIIQNFKEILACLCIIQLLKTWPKLSVWNKSESSVKCFCKQFSDSEHVYWSNKKYM